ncbi:hypothetical protein CBS101457_000904 [Exobasidium rhododendri]|nr:hypothetical protein CBS101457_000904 [Exobasidium rhododendri]
MSDPSSTSSQKDVMKITADLAERQATAVQLPRLSSNAHTSPDRKRISAKDANDASIAPVEQRGAKGHINAEDEGSEPRVDEDAIVRMTMEQRNVPALEQDRVPEIMKEISSPEDVIRRRKSMLVKEPRNRMTVMMDEEMPSGDEGVEESDDEESGGEEHKMEEESGPLEQSKEEQLRLEHEQEIVEQDADIGEEEVVVEGRHKGIVGEDIDGRKIKDAAASQTTRTIAAEENTTMDSIASLEALRQTSGKPDDLAVGGRQEEIVEVTSDDDDDDDDDDEEPTLKYSRLKGSVPDVLKKDTASCVAVSDRFLALGTHSGAIYILDEQGNLIKGFRSHTASVLDLVIDSTSDFIGSAGMDGLVSISSLSSSEAYSFDFKRVMRTISVEPSFGRRSTRSFVCGGMAGQLVLREKSWFGHRETILHEGEGPIWTSQWRGNLIAWATDRGVRIYDTQSRQRISLISPPLDNPRADLFRCSLFWQDEATLLIAWADHIKVAKVRQRKKKQGATPAAASASPMQLYVEVTAILQLDCMISGISPRGKDYLILAYITEETYNDTSSDLDNREAQKRKDGLRPELRLVSSDGDELSSDVLSLDSFARFQCNDYLLVPSSDAVASGANAIKTSTASSASQRKLPPVADDATSDYFYVVSPKDIVIARSRDEKDHVDWLLQHKHYHDALQYVEAMGTVRALSMGFDADVIGKRYLAYLLHEKQDFAKASKVAPSILKVDAKAWEDIIFTFIEKKQLSHIIPFVPIEVPRLSGVIYDMILAHFLRFDLPLLFDTIKRWPAELFSTRAVVLAMEDRLSGDSNTNRLLMECLAEVHIKNRQPGKALPYFLRLRKPGVFDLIREHNLFTVIQDQALLLVEFEEDIKQPSRSSKHGPAIDLLVDHTHSIPIPRVVSQLQVKPKYLYEYLDALFDRDPQQVANFSDIQVKLYAEYEYDKLMSYLRAMSSHYSFEKAYNVCKQFDYVPEMVFLLSRIGDNKTALTLIIERLHDVERAIEFVKEEKDAELWEDLLRYSENKPRFIKGLLENVGSEVDAVKLIKRIKNGLEIEGLKMALIKILSDYNLQISLLEGCEAILTHDGRTYSQILHQGQSLGQYCDRKETLCFTCGEKLFEASASSAASSLPINSILFLCRHTHHLSCLVNNVESIPKITSNGRQQQTPNQALVLAMNTTQALASGNHYACGPYGPQVRNKQYKVEQQERLRYQNRLKVILKKGCPICLNESSIEF